MSEARKGLKHLTLEQREKLRNNKYKVKVRCVETGMIL